MIPFTPVGVLADMLNARDNPWKALLMIDCGSYFDDSGTHGGSVVTIIAGYAAPKAVWEELEPPWRAILNEHKDKGIHYFHAAHCLAQGGQFGRLEKPHCIYVYKQLSDILEKSAADPIYVAVWNDDWEAVANEYPNFRRLCPSAYDFCIDRVMGQLVSWSSNNAGGSKVPIVIAIQKEHEAETLETTNSWMGHKIVSDLVGAVAFEYPDALIPLQAADMLAHEVYRHATWWNAMERGLPVPTEGFHPRVLDKIMRGRRMTGGGLLDREYIEIFARDVREKSA